MNLELIDPHILSHEYPERLTQVLEFGQAVCLKFNANGDYLASGQFDGTIVVIDLDTFGVARVLRFHVRPVQSVNWSKCGRYLVSCASDFQICVWDVSSGEPIVTLRLDAPVLEVHFLSHFKVCVVTLSQKLCVLEIPNTKNPDNTTNNIEIRPFRDSENSNDIVSIALTTDGNYILGGTTKGTIEIYSAETFDHLWSHSVCMAGIKNMYITPNGSYLLINSSDRAIRLIPLALEGEPSSWTLDVEHKFQDKINKLAFNTMTSSPSGDYVLATIYQAKNDVYMWEIMNGSLVKIYEGPKEELLDVAWHPSKPLIVASGLDSGAIYVWSVVPPQRWATLAPDFVEVEENIQYKETEREFDIIERHALTEVSAESQDIMVDLHTLNRPANTAFAIPVKLDAYCETL
ncbi:hypothetical protein CANCADRAFT_137131 [Tortispora caseinolytica NRRL Y-17796]|uniref:Anaphase-promoting complex subunit 4 WD40 domain-containing protein n=1 Tax=Tortispora caseinolytica NRRL Y-17796 TaxID=767744 RepID=A0A1E4TC06_9ASCO|nr:hypothetical protein CANCADRAFT_137131 [Tortispora caseinolytica NRRL Y-17796]